VNPYFDPRWLYAQRQAQAQQLAVAPDQEPVLDEEQQLASVQATPAAQSYAEQSGIMLDDLGKARTSQPLRPQAQFQGMATAPAPQEDEQLQAYKGRFR
jgi:hypothetical protein